jgi:hypothetical protein
MRVEEPAGPAKRILDRPRRIRVTTDAHARQLLAPLSWRIGGYVSAAGAAAVVLLLAIERSYWRRRRNGRIISAGGVAQA